MMGDRRRAHRQEWRAAPVAIVEDDETNAKSKNRQTR